MQILSAKKLRAFGLTLFLGLTLVGLIPKLRGHEPRSWALGVAFIFGFFVLFMPKMLRWPYRIWMWLGEILGWVNTRVLLGIVFFLVVTPIGLIRRLFKRESQFYVPSTKSLETYAIPVAKRDSKHFDYQF